jgi:hypothetical protein
MKTGIRYYMRGRLASRSSALFTSAREGGSGAEYAVVVSTGTAAGVGWAQVVDPVRDMLHAAVITCVRPDLLWKPQELSHLMSVRTR